MTHPVVIPMSKPHERRVQVVFPQDEYRILDDYAREIGRPLSHVVRECVERYLLPEVEEGRKAVALAWFRDPTEGDPVTDWDTMERELERGRFYDPEQVGDPGKGE